MSEAYGPVEVSRGLFLHMQETVNGSHQSLKLGDIPVPKKDSLKQEFVALKEYWGESYWVELLLKLNKTGLKTHVPVGEISIDGQFEREGKEGDGGAGIRKVWQRVSNPFGPDVVDGKVAAKVTYAFDKTAGKVDLFPVDTIVRPCCDMCLFYTPQEIHQARVMSDLNEKILTEMTEQVDTAINGDIYVIYSAFPEKDGVYINNLSEIAAQGRAIFVCECDFEDDEEEHGPYESTIVENPTWLEVAVLANDMIKRTGDHHHVFLEGIYINKKLTAKRTDGVKVYEFSMGS